MIGFGIIGCGRIAERHLSSLSQCEGGELVALCDISKERLIHAAESYSLLRNKGPQIKLYTEASQMLEDERVKVVVIATHSALHADLAKAALKQGKHVVLEKPMTLSLSDADQLIKLADERKLYIQVCHQLRYKPIMKKLKELIESGAMGKIYLGVISIRLSRSAAYYEAARWRGTWDQDGGMLLNQGIHLIDLLQWYMGDYNHVYGTLLSGSLPKETEDAAAGIVHFQNGGIGVIEANTLTVPNNLDNCLSLFGEKGTVSIGGVGLQEIRRWSFQDESIQPPEQKNDEHLEMYEMLISALQGNSASLITGYEGRRALELIFALYNSHLTKQVSTQAPFQFSTALMANKEGWT